MPTVQPYSATAQVKSLAGTVALPGITFIGDTDTGFYSPAANQVAITTGGVQRLLIGSDGSITPSGSLLFPAGTASAPSLSFAGDTNTGIYSPGADQVAISTGGTGRLFVDASGRLGIGTSSPNYTLDVAGTINANATVRTSNGTHIGILGSEAFAAGVVGVGSTSNHPLVLGTNSLERLRITSAGLVGIGTSSPTQLLTVIGSSFVGSSFNGQTIGDGSAERIRIGYKDGNPDTGLVPAQILTDATTLSIAARDIVNSAIRFHTGSGTSERVRIDSAGQVGIGTSSPTENLTIYGNSSRFSVTGLTGSSAILLGNQNSGGANNPSVIEAANGALYFGGGNSWSGGGTFDYTMTLTNDNKVGIGSTNPNHLLSVTASAGAQDIFLAGQIGVSNGYQITSNGTALTHAWFNSGSEAARIDSSGRVGIGTSSPSEKLTVAGTSGSAAISLLETGVRNWAIRAGGAVTNSLDIADLTAGATRLTVNSSGFVGIGTSTPQASLDIASGTFQAVRTNLSSVTDTFHQYRGTPDGVGYEHARVFSGRDTSVHTYGSYLAFYTEGKASGTTDTSLERLRIDSSGRVGIGTTSPAVNAHIFGSQAALRIESSNTDARLQLTSSSGTWVVGNSVGGTGNYLSFYDVTASSERARIDSSGRLGIGTTSPAGKTEIVSSGSESTLILRNSNGAPSTYSELKFAPFTGTTAAAAAIRAEYYQDDNSSLAFRTTNTNAEPTTKMFIDQVGRVGIGTSSPSFTAHVSGAKNTTQLFVAAPTISAVNDFTQIGFGLSNTEFGLIRLGFDNPSAITNSYFSFFNNTGSGLQESLRIDSSGRVGIGTSSPSASLSVASTTTAYTATSFNIGEPSTSTGRQLYMGYNTTDGVGFIQPVHWGTEFKPLVLCPNGGRVGIGTTSPTAKLTLSNLIDSTPSAVSQLHLYNDLAGVIAGFGVSSSQLNYRAPGAHVWIDGTTERARIDSSGRLLVGTSSARQNLFNTTYSALLQVESQTTGNAQASFTSSTAGINGANLILCHQRSGSSGGNTIVQAEDQLGIVSFQGADGTEMVPAASVEVYVDGTPGANDMPGRLVFSTTADGASSPTERLRITSAGNVGIGTTTPRAQLHLYGVNQNTANLTDSGGREGFLRLSANSSSAGAGGGILFANVQGDGANSIGFAAIKGLLNDGSNNTAGDLAFATRTSSTASSLQECLRITSAGLVGVGTSSPTALLHVAGSATAANWSFNTTQAAVNTGTGIFAPAGDTIGFAGGGSERARIDSSGRLLVGTSSTSAAARVLVSGGDGARGVLNIASTSATPADGDDLGFISFNDSSHIYNNALIRAQRDGGTWTATTSKPTRLTFSTTADGASSPTERLRITSAGLVGVGTSSPSYSLDISGIIRAGNGFLISQNGGSAVKAGAAGQPDFNNPGSDFYFSVTAGQKFAWGNSANRTDMTLDSSGRLGIGTTSPGDVLDTAAGNYRGITIKCGTTTNRPTLSFFNTADSLAAYIQAIGSSLAFGRMGTDYGGHTETARLDSSGRLGIGTSSPSYLLDVASSVAQVGNSTDAFIQYKSTAGNWHVGANSSNAYVFYAGTYGSGTERARIDSSGRLLVGTSSARQGFFNGVAQSPQLEIEGLGLWESSAAYINNENSTGGHGLVLARSRGTSKGSFTIVQNSDVVGGIYYQGADGTDFVDAARITCEVDGTPGANDMPGRLVFSTTADGASSPTERMRITSSGNVGIGTASPNSRLAVNGSITESTDGGTTYHNVVTAQDIGTDPNQVPLNQFLGQLAFMDEVGDVPTASAPPQDNLSVNFEYVSNTSIKIRMRGTDGVVRSVTLTLS